MFTDMQRIADKYLPERGGNFVPDFQIRDLSPVSRKGWTSILQFVTNNGGNGKVDKVITNRLFTKQSTLTRRQWKVLDVWSSRENIKSHLLNSSRWNLRKMITKMYEETGREIDLDGMDINNMWDSVLSPIQAFIVEQLQKWESHW